MNSLTNFISNALKDFVLHIHQPKPTSVFHSLNSSKDTDLDFIAWLLFCLSLPCLQTAEANIFSWVTIYVLWYRNYKLHKPVSVHVLLWQQYMFSINYLFCRSSQESDHNETHIIWNIPNRCQQLSLCESKARYFVHHNYLATLELSKLTI